MTALMHAQQSTKALYEDIYKPESHDSGSFGLSPVWNCRPWTVKKLQQRPYGELIASEKVGKFLIPLRNNLAFRMLVALPKRSLRELGSARSKDFLFQYRALDPALHPLSRYPHISDGDAFVDIDAHAALVYFRSRGWECSSHRSVLDRIACRGEEIVVVKPKSVGANPQ